MVKMKKAGIDKEPETELGISRVKLGRNSDTSMND